MSKFDDSLRGYSFDIHRRDNFKCRYCGVDGTKSFDTWLTLSSDHLLPKDHPDRNNPDYIVTACNFCNTADNHYFEKAKAYGLKFDGLTPDELVAQRRPYVQGVRQQRRDFWEEHVNIFAKQPTMSEREYPCEYCDTTLPLEDRLVTLTMTHEGRWHIFENVPARVCQNCGHRYYDGPLLLKLERMMLEERDQARPVEAWAFSLPVPEDQ